MLNYYIPLVPKFNYGLQYKKVKDEHKSRGLCGELFFVSGYGLVDSGFFFFFGGGGGGGGV
jgi:hypothetical protein